MKAPLWGTCDSLNVVVAVPKDELRPLLTDDLDFTPQNFTEEGYHPVIFQANTQLIRVLFPCFRKRYYEMIPLIPYIHFKNKPEVSYQSAPILYVSSWAVVFGARLLWHLNKVLSKFKLSTPVRELPKVGKLREQVWRKSVEAIDLNATVAGSTGKAADFPNFQKVSTLFIRNALIYNDKSQYWAARYQVEVGEVQPVEGEVIVKNVEGLESKTYTAPGIDKALLGGYRYRFKWWLWKPKRYRL